MKLSIRTTIAGMVAAACVSAWTPAAQAQDLPEELVALFEQLGIPYGDAATPAADVPETPSSQPTPTDQPVNEPIDIFEILGLDPADYPPTSNPVEPDPQPKVDPEVVEPVGLSEDEIEFFRMIGIEITASGEVIPPQNPGPAEPVEIIDTEEELQDFFTSVGITIDENGSPVTSTPTELPPATPSDINELLSSLGIPYGSPAFAQAVAANSSLAVPEPSSLLLAGMLANFALLRRKRT